MLDRIRDVRQSLAGLRRPRRADAAPRTGPAPGRAESAAAELAALDAQKAELLEKRRELQRVLGPRYDRESVPLGRVEKTNGTPSFVAGVRMMQRVHRRADNPAHGVDGAGAVFADRDQTLRFVRSHHVPALGVPAPGPADRTVVVHAFHGTVGLVEVRSGDRVRHVDGRGTDLGDVRPATTHDPSLELPEPLDRVVGWSATLSEHVCRPYVQVVWRQQEDRLVPDAIDVDPERVPVLTEEEDIRLGRLFETGHARMLTQPFLAGALENRVPGGVFEPDRPLRPTVAR